MRDDWLDLAEAAALRLADRCRAARAARPAGRNGVHATASVKTCHGHAVDDVPVSARDAVHAAVNSQAALWQRDAELQRAVAALQQLLDDFRAQRQPADRQAFVMQQASSSGLLALPMELLLRVTEPAGKDIRLVCQHLRAACLPPARATLKEPLHGWEVEAIEARSGGPCVDERNTHHPVDQLRLNRELLAAICPPLPNPIAAIQGCVGSWPAHFTALELSGVRGITFPALRAIHQALPGLRELKCAWPAPLLPGEPACGVPVFTALTSLALLSSVEDVLTSADKEWNKHVRNGAYAALQAAPAVRSLQLDLRFRPVHGVDQALAQLPQLAHLEVAFNEVIVYGDDDAKNGCPLQDTIEFALSAVAPHLQSLKFRTPTGWLLAADRIVDRMTQLTRLNWAYPTLPASLPADTWGSLPGPSTMARLRELTLEQVPVDAGWATTDSNLDQLSGLFQGPCSLAALSLPALHMSPRSDGYDPGALLQQAHHLGALLAACSQHCPHLTSLQAGCVPIYPDDWYDPITGAWVHPGADDMPLWLLPAVHMSNLRRVALLLPPAEIVHLVCLAPLQSLTSLWLQLAGRGRTRGTHEPFAHYFPAHVLTHLTTLRDLTIGMTRTADQAMDEAVTALLGAVGALPRLEVLVTYDMVQCMGSEAPWDVLVQNPPPMLRQLAVHSGSYSNGGGESQAAAEAAEPVLSYVLQLLRDGLPRSVQVSSCTGLRYSTAWGPAPWSSCDS